MAYQSPVIIQQSRDKKKIELEFEYDRNVIECIKTLPNARWNATLGFWQLPNDYRSLLGLVKLLTEAKFTFVLDSSIQEEYTRIAKELREKVETQKATSEVKKLEDVADDEFNHFIKPEFKLMPYQKVGVKFIDVGHGTGMIADGMGLGKSLEATAYVALNKYRNSLEPQLKKNHRALVITLASLKINWKNEIEKFTDCSVNVVWSGQKLNEDDDYDFTILNYEQLIARKDTGESNTLRSLLDLINKGYFKTVILDESQKIKNPKSKTTKAVHTNLIKIPERILLTGTPIKNRTIELWAQLYFLDPLIWSSYFSFGKKWCAGFKNSFGGWDFSGSSNLKQLYEIISPYFIRRSKEEVMKELPRKLWKTVNIQMTPKEQRDYEAIEFDFMTRYLLESSNVALAQLQQLKLFTSHVKIKAAKEIIDSILESDKKAIVFTMSVEIVDAILAHYQDVPHIRFVGSDVRPQDRMKLVDQFQNDPNTKLFVSTSQAGGVGLTLTAASNVIFIDLPWTPGDMAQCEDRAHRKGQQDNVLVTILQCQDTVDVKIHEKLEEKREVISRAIDNEEYSAGQGTESNILNDIIAYYKEKRAGEEMQKKIRMTSKITKDPKAAKKTMLERADKKVKLATRR